MMLTVDKNGKDATEAGFDPENIVQWGFEPQRDDMRQTGAYWKAGSLRRGRRQDRPDPGRLGGRLEARSTTRSGRTTRRSTRPQFLNTDFNPNGYPFFTGKVAMSENYLWSLYGVVGRRRRLGHGGDPVVPGPDHRRLQRRHVPHPQGHQAPRRGVHGAAVPAGQTGAAQALRRHAGHRVAAGRLPAGAARPTTPSPSTGRSRRRASTTRTCRTSRATCRPTTRPTTWSSSSGRSGSPRRG